jgi:PAS domain S-box-containing protein
MNLKNIKIETQLKFGFALMLLLVVFMGFIAYEQTNQIHEQTKYLYNHPLKVRRSIGELKADILIIHRDMKNLFMAKDEAEFEQNIFELGQTENKVFGHINDIYANYLGPKSDVDTLKSNYELWNSMRKETIRLLKEKNVKIAAERTKSYGIAGNQVQLLMKSVQKIDDFARDKADEFYQNSSNINYRLNLQLGFFVVIVLLISLIVQYFILRNINRPIHILTKVTKDFSDGDYSVRSNYTLQNELGGLSNAFNSLAEKLEENLRLNEKVYSLSEIMLHENDTKQFFIKTLSKLTEQTSAQIAAIYLLNDQKRLVHIESIGLNEEIRKEFSVENFEGEFGAAIINNQVHHLKNIPENSKFVFNTINGAFIPNEIITIPVVTGNKLIGIISLGKIGHFNAEALNLISKTKDTLSARLESVLSSAKISAFSEKLKETNIELEKQKVELYNAGSYNRGLIEASIDPLVTIGPDGKITDVNQSTELITGYIREELIGTDFSFYFSDPATAKKGYEMVFQNGLVRDYELELKHKNGQLTYVTYNASVYKDGNGNVVGVFAAARDITERKQAEANQRQLHEELEQRSKYLEVANTELELQKNELSAQTDELSEQNTELEMQKKQLDEANRLKSAFLSNMSHELRTPLNSVIALSGVLSRKLKGKIQDDEYSYLDVISKNGKNLLYLINEILDLSRIEAGKEEIDLTAFSIPELVSDLLSMLQPTADEKGIKLINTIPSNLELIISDRTKVRHILINLIANAVKFTTEGQVEVTLKRKPNYLGIAIKDTGIGIDPEVVEVIFDEFRQADERTSRKFGGSGLGLAIAKKYSEICNGYIEVETLPEKGSTFTLFLPIIEDANIHRSKSVQNKKNAGDENVIKLRKTLETTILIVEDSEPQILQLSELLSEEGYKVLVARNGQEALEIINQSIPDAIILDLMMPEMDGFEVLNTIRQQFETKIPVLILTARHISKEELSVLKGNNINQLVQKGELNPAELLKRIESILPEKTSFHREAEPPFLVKKAGDPTLLLVEDNPDNSMTIKALLGDKYFLLTAEDGITGLQKAINYKPHLVLLDISLPGLDGFEVLRGIRENEIIKNTPVVAVTARAMKGDKEALLAYGFDAYVPKPVDNELLESTINHLLYGK